MNRPQFAKRLLCPAAPRVVLAALLVGVIQSAQAADAEGLRKEISRTADWLLTMSLLEPRESKGRWLRLEMRNRSGATRALPRKGAEYDIIVEVRDDKDNLVVFKRIAEGRGKTIFATHKPNAVLLQEVPVSELIEKTGEFRVKAYWIIDFNAVYSRNPFNPSVPHVASNVLMVQTK